MNIILPDRIDGTPAQVLENVRQVTLIGANGSGKTRFYAKPNIMNANTSFITLDCKGEILRDTTTIMKKGKGWE